MKVTGANIDELTQKAELEFHDEATTRFADMNRLLDDIAGSQAPVTVMFPSCSGTPTICASPAAPSAFP